MVSALNHPNVSFIIHINKKVDLAANSIISKLNEWENITFLTNRVKVNWGGFSHLIAIIKMMKMALNISNAGYFHLMSDSCYPIKSIEEICSFFEENKGKEFIEYTELPSTEWTFGGLHRIEYYHLHDIIPVKKNKLNWMLNEYFMLLQKHLKLKRSIGSQTYYGGSPWWSLTKEAVQYCINEIEHATNFYKKNRHTFCFEESCFQTILANSPFKEKMINTDLRYVDWRNRNGNTPANLDETDFETLTTSADLFARKFVYPTGDILRQKLQAYLKHGSV